MTAHTSFTRTAVLGTNGTLTLPAEVLASLGLQPGADVTITVDKYGHVSLHKTPDPETIKAVRERIDSLRGMLAGGPSTDEILRMTRGEPPP